MRARLLVLSAACFMLWGAGMARAQEGSPPDYEAAKRHFKAGQEFLQMDRYAEAIVEFNKAYGITKDGLVMGQVADAYAKAGDYENAMAAIKIYRESLPEGERVAAGELIKEYERAIKEGRSKKLVLPTEEKAAEAEEEEAEEKKVAQAAAKEGGKKRLFYTWIAAGAAGVMTLSAIVIGLNAQSKYDDLSNKCSPNCYGEYASEVDSVRTRAITADVLWGLAITAGIATGVLYWYEGRSVAAQEDTDDKEESPADEEPEEDIFSSIRLSPVVGAGSYGVSAGLRF